MKYKRLKGWYSRGTEFEIISKPHEIFFIGDKARTYNFKIRFTTLVELSVTLETKIRLNIT